MFSSTYSEKRYNIIFPSWLFGEFDRCGKESISFVVSIKKNQNHNITFMFKKCCQFAILFPRSTSTLIDYLVFGGG